MCIFFSLNAYHNTSYYNSGFCKLYVDLQEADSDDTIIYDVQEELKKIKKRKPRQKSTNVPTKAKAQLKSQRRQSYKKGKICSYCKILSKIYIYRYLTLLFNLN